MITLAAIIAALPALLQTEQEVLRLLSAIREAAKANGVAEENALLDTAIADAVARLLRED